MTDLSEAAEIRAALLDSLNRSAPGTISSYQALALDARRAVGEIEHRDIAIRRGRRGKQYSRL